MHGNAEKIISVFKDEVLKGRKTYELRLSDDEVEALKREYPRASFSEDSELCEDGKKWFNINII